MRTRIIALTNCYSVEGSVKDDVAAVKGSTLVRKELADHTFGFVFDVKSGRLSKVGF